jgi:glutathione S-transferase
MLEELGLPYSLHMLPFPPRVLAREFLQQNPLGTVPLLVDGDTRMTESAAMCQYLAARYSPNTFEVSPTDSAYGNYLNYLHMGEATLTFPQTLVLRYTYFESIERRQPQVAADYSRWFLARLRGIEMVIQEQDYICANRFTAADISVGYALLLAEHLGFKSAFPPAVDKYWERLTQRPAYQRALQVQHQEAIAQGISTVPAPDVR